MGGTGTFFAFAYTRRESIFRKKGKIVMRRSSIRLICLLFILVAFGVLSVSAQTAPEPLQLDENQTGTLSTAAPTIRYALLIDTPSVISARVFAITPGLAPTVRVLDIGGALLIEANNGANATAVQTAPLSVEVGVYQIEVSSANGVLGDYLVNVEAAELAPPQALPGGTPVTGEVSAGASRRAYAFSGAGGNGLILVVQSSLTIGGPNIVLKDADTDETLATSSARLRGARYQIPAGIANYLVEITYGGLANTEPYVICLASDTAPQTCPLEVGGAPQSVVVATEAVVPTLAPTFLAPLPPSNVCIAASATGQVVNVRQGPATTFPVVTQVNSTTIANVLGKLPDNSWYLVNVGGVTGWMSRSVIRFGGPCDTVPNIVPTATATIGATLTPTSTGTLTTATPTSTPTPTSPSPVATLNFSLPPVFGSTALISGFLPDPFTVGITAGGPANVGYLGSGCAGNATSAPSFSVTYTSGSFTLLRFYFIGSGDTTMVVNSPSRSYFCNDDSFSTNNPTVDFNTPTSGRYDVWIGTFVQGANISGTLYVTERSSNRP